MDEADMIRVLEEQATPQQLDNFSHWMASAEAHRQHFRHVRQLWMDARGPWPTPISQEPLDRIHKRMHTRLRQRKVKWTIVQLAAMTIIATVLWWVVIQINDRKQPARQLIFNATTLTEVAATLEQKFHTHIVFEQQALANCRFTGSFSKATTLQDIMQAIAHGLYISIEDTGGAYRWRGEGC
ncbi:MAG: DUF4974 domain-containing protein [Cyclobacteriaceae bacterium]|jgi:ferric-dicitrate binding protein FerR (iron transport regulator)|nr:DUF4974 domain-containing protein [Cyclobacteriaceae bacterium]